MRIATSEQPSRSGKAITSLLLALALGPGPPGRADASELLQASYLGGARDDEVRALAIGPDGTVYVAGRTASDDLPGPDTTLPPELGRSAGDDGFITRLTADRRAVLARIYLGGVGDDGVTSLAIDEFGDVLVGGTGNSDDFPPEGAASLRGGLNDGFLAKLPADLSVLTWCLRLGGSANDSLNAIAVLSNGDVLAVGQTSSADFPTRPATSTGLGGESDAFFAVVNADGNQLLRSTLLGGSGREDALAVASTQEGQAFIAGWTESPDFPLVDSLSHPGDDSCTPDPECRDGFVMSFEQDASEPTGSTLLGGHSHDQISALAVAPDGGVFLTGTTSSANFPLMNARQATLLTGTSGFVTRLTPPPFNLSWSTFLSATEGGRGGSVRPEALTLGPSGRVFVVGRTTSPAFPTIGAVQEALSSPWGSAFSASYTPNGGFLRHSSYFGGSSAASALSPHFPSERARAAVVTAAGDLVFGGTTYTLDFPLAHALQQRHAGPTDLQLAGADGFVASISVEMPVIVPEPFDVRMGYGHESLVISWEETNGTNRHVLLRGTLESLRHLRTYDHVAVPPCDLDEPSTTLPMVVEDSYFLVVSYDSKVGQAMSQSSYGRDSQGLERPVGPTPCP